MTDKFTKTRPWRVVLLCPIQSTVMGHTIEQSAGERMMRTKQEALEFRAAVTAESGDCCSEVFRAGSKRS